MQEYILPFLAKHRQVSIEGIGTFYKKVDEPTWNPVAQEFSNPSDTIIFENGASDTSQKFIDYISNKQDSDPQAVIETIKGLQLKSKIEIAGIGVLENQNGQLILKSLQEQYLQKIEAPRTIQNQAHQIVVGDNLMTNESMQAYYEYEKPSKRWSWLYAAWIITIVTLAYIFFYYYHHS